jgi:hypothetical protein
MDKVQKPSNPECMLRNIRHAIIFSAFKSSLKDPLSVTIGRAAWEACSATWNLGNNSAFALVPRKTTENLD